MKRNPGGGLFITSIWKLEPLSLEALPLVPKTDGSFATELELPTGQSYEFRYLLDDIRWENDWTADAYLPSPYAGIYNSVVSLEMQAKAEAPAKATKAPKAPAAAKAPPKKAAAPKAPKAKAAASDQLTKIEGIGPKIAGLLVADGIDTFAKLAKASPKKLQEILTAAGPRYKMHNPGSWPEQAALAAKGDWDTLKTLQDKLQGGK